MAGTERASVGGWDPAFRHYAGWSPDLALHGPWAVQSRPSKVSIVHNGIRKAIKVHYFTHPPNLSILLYLICDEIVEKGYLM